MAKRKINTDLFDRAASFALEAHRNVERRGHGSPYVIHVFEAAAICETMTNDPEILAAAVLHDVVEDTDTTIEEIEELFGSRVAEFVRSESEIPVVGKTKAESWIERKHAAMERIEASSYESKIVAMGDKLSNMRAIARDYKRHGEEFWSIFNVKDPALHEWHYRGLAQALRELKDTEAYQEFEHLIEETFPGSHHPKARKRRWLHRR